MTEHCGQPIALRMHRILSRHEDNPSIDPAYLRRLRSMTGVRRQRLYEGLWVSAEGQVWDNYRRSTHVIPAREVRVPGDERLWLRVDTWETPETPEAAHFEIKWTIGAIDWGYRNPGVFQVWGMTPVGEQTRMIRLAEVYRKGILKSQWAQWIEELDRLYRLRVIVADPADPGSIEYLNDHLDEHGRRGVGRIVIPADNQKRVTKKGEPRGLDLVRECLEPLDDGRPGMLFVAGAFPFGADPDLVADRNPACTEDEIPGYIWRKTPDGRPIKDETEPTCPDHGCDATRYGAAFVHRKDLSHERQPPDWSPGTYGHELDDLDLGPDAE